MIKQEKVQKLQEIVERLKLKKNFILTNYSGITVKGLTELRRQLREKGVEYKVVKNNLFKKALKDLGYADIEDSVKGPLGIAFSNTDLTEAAKILKNYKKDHEKFSFSLGIMDNVVYDESQVKRIADIPSKEVLISQIMSLINSSARGLATVVNQDIAKVARAIKAVGEKNSAA